MTDPATTWQPGDPVHPNDGHPELYCGGCGTRVAGPNLDPGPCPECGALLSFDPSACLDRWRLMRDQAAGGATVQAVAATLRQLATWGAVRQEMSDQEFYDLATQVDQLEPGWSCPMCEEATCDGGCPLEHVRADLAAVLVAAETAADQPPRWRLLCYGKPAGDLGPLPEAFAAADAHIHTCPQGAMPWADPVVWHRTDLPALNGMYVASSNGWLNHGIEPAGFDEPDEAVADVVAAFDRGVKRTTAPPASTTSTVTGDGDGS